MDTPVALATPEAATVADARQMVRSLEAGTAQLFVVRAAEDGTPAERRHHVATLAAPCLLPSAVPPHAGLRFVVDLGPSAKLTEIEQAAFWDVSASLEAGKTREQAVAALSADQRARLKTLEEARKLVPAIHEAEMMGFLDGPGGDVGAMGDRPGPPPFGAGRSGGPQPRGGRFGGGEPRFRQ